MLHRRRSAFGPILIGAVEGPMTLLATQMTNVVIAARVGVARSPVEPMAHRVIIDAIREKQIC